MLLDQLGLGRHVQSSLSCKNLSCEALWLLYRIYWHRLSLGGKVAEVCTTRLIGALHPKAALKMIGRCKVVNGAKFIHAKISATRFSYSFQL